MPTVIREARQSESFLLTEIALSSKAYWGYSEEFMLACRDELNVSIDKISSETFTYYVCESNAEVIGYYALEKLNQKEAELEALFVKPKYIGTGVGRILMEHALHYAKSCGFYTLKILSDPNAENFYLASGAVREGELESESVKGRYLPVLKHYLMEY